MVAKHQPTSANSKTIQHTNHSFLFWLLVPLLMLWLSFGYIVGFIKDRPSWYRPDPKTNVSSVVPFLQTHSPVSETVQPYITLWFDDAWLSQYTKAYPQLKDRGLRGTIAVPTQAIETRNYVNWAQLRVLQKNGWEITNHSISHDCDMDTWDRDKISAEYKDSRLAMWKQGLATDIFVTPCGVDSEIMRQEAAKYFFAYRTVNPGDNDLSALDFYDLRVRNIDDNTTLEMVKTWVDQAKLDSRWLILVFHKIDDNSPDTGEEKYNISLDDFKTVLDYITSSQVEVVTPSQVILTFVK